MVTIFVNIFPVFNVYNASKQAFLIVNISLNVSRRVLNEMKSLQFLLCKQCTSWVFFLILNVEAKPTVLDLK